MENYNQIKNHIINEKIRLLVMEPKVIDDEIYKIVEETEFEGFYLECLKQKNT
jgi:hypothetical protein